MALSPLAARIYEVLTHRARTSQPLISYGDLVRALGPLPAPYAGLAPNVYLTRSRKSLARAKGVGLPCRS